MFKYCYALQGVGIVEALEKNSSKQLPTPKR